MLYNPPHFSNDDREAALAAVARHPFAALVSETHDGPFASHLPMLFEPAGGPNGRLIGHVARANPHWKLALPGRLSLAIFSGPDAYVSPNWYPSKTVEGKAVPTWNYVVVQARGMLRWIDDAADLRRIVTVLTDRFEAQRPAPWQVSDAPESYIAAMLRGIVGVELVIDTLAFKQKLSQNRSTEDRDGVVAGLADDPEDAGKELRALMLAKRGAS